MNPKKARLLIFLLMVVTSNSAQAFECPGYDLYSLWPALMNQSAHVVANVCCESEPGELDFPIGGTSVLLPINLHLGHKIKIRNEDISLAEDVVINCNDKLKGTCLTFRAKKIPRMLPNGLDLRVYKGEPIAAPGEAEKPYIKIITMVDPKHKRREIELKGIGRGNTKCLAENGRAAIPFIYSNTEASGDLNK